MAEKAPRQRSPVNTAKYFVMRPIELTDAELMADWYQKIEDVSIFDRQLPLPISSNQVSVLVKSLIDDQHNDKCQWFIAITPEGSAVGMTGLESINMLHGHAVLPMFIADKWRRSGVGIRMACMMIDLAFRQLRLNRVTTMYRSDNAASEKLLERLGFRQEGTARQAWFNEGKYRDLVNVGMLQQEWEEVRAPLRSALDPQVKVQLGRSDMWCWP